MPRESSSPSSTREVGAPSADRTADASANGSQVTEAAVDTDSMHALLREVASAPPRGLEAGGHELAVGDMIGKSFRIEGPLGAGGMGVVYKARDLDLDRPVAIKVRRGAADAGDVARLLREAKVMAQLSHPNVVTVYEVGTHQGRLFIAMEYVDAGSMRAWSKEKPRGWREILALFEQAGRGLSAAHAVGLIHRDFKPDNVLVDRTGRARVADFGVARLAEASAPAADLRSLETSSLGERLTRTGAAVGTPAYMAPEQFLGGEIGPAADQFAFCVSLHEALWGVRPFEGGDVNELIAAVALERIATPKSGDVPTWVRRAIVRGLRASPDDRWPSLDALLTALGRDPAARRRRTALVAAALVATGGGAWWTAAGSRVEPCVGTETAIAEVWSARRRDSVAEAFEATSLVHAAIARDAVVTALDAYRDKWAVMARDTCVATRVREDQSERLMDLRMACLSERSSALEGVVRVLVSADRKVVTNATALVAALPSIDRCADTEQLLEGVAPPDDPDTARTVSDLRARLAEYQALAKARKPRGAIEEIPGLLAEAEATHYEPLVVETLFVKGQLEEDTGVAREAEADYDDALWRAIRIGHDELVPRIALKLAFAVGYTNNDRDQGERLLRLSEASAGATAAPELLANIQAVRGAMALHDRDLEGAEAAYRARLALEEESAGPDHPRVADALGGLAEALDLRGRFEEAEAAYQRAITIAEAALGPEHPKVGTLVGDLAVHRGMMGDMAGAVPLYERAVAIEEEAVGPDAPALIHLLQNLSKAKIATDDVDGAEVTLARALAIRDGSDQPESMNDARLLETRMLVDIRRRRWEECSALADEAVAITERVLGPEHADLAVALANGARCDAELEHHEQATRRLERALAVREKAFGAASEPVAQMLTMLADLHMAMDRYDAVIADCDRGIAILESLKRESSPYYEHMVAKRDDARARR